MKTRSRTRMSMRCRGAMGGYDDDAADEDDGEEPGVTVDLNGWR